MRQTAFIGAALVTELAVATTAGLLLGNWLDQRWNTSPALVMLLTGAGFVGGMFRVHHGLQRLQDTDEPDPPNTDS